MAPRLGYAYYRFIISSTYIYISLYGCYVSLQYPHFFFFTLTFKSQKLSQSIHITNLVCKLLIFNFMNADLHDTLITLLICNHYSTNFIYYLLDLANFIRSFLLFNADLFTMILMIISDHHFRSMIYSIADCI